MKPLRFIKAFALVGVVFAAATGCKKDSEPAPVPEIKIETPAISLPEEASEIVINYTVSNPTEGVQLKASSQAEWLHFEGVDPDKVKFIADENPVEEPRNGEIVLSYQGAKDVKVQVSQVAKYVTPKTLTFELKVLDVKSRQVIVECIPSDPNATYIAMVTYKSNMEKWPDDDALIANDMDYFKEWGSVFGSDWTTFLRRGNMENYDITIDKPDTDYMFYAYGLNEDGSVTSPQVYRAEFHTPLPEAQECTFQFNYRPGINFGRVNVYPSDIHVSYIWGVMSKSEYNALPSDKAQAIVDKIKADMASQGGTWRDYVGYHNKFKNYTNLTDGEDYVAYAFGADITGVPTTAAMTYEFTAKTLKKVACSFAVGFQDVRATTFAANITPTADVTWAAYTLPYEYLEKYNGSAENMTEVVIDTFNESVKDWWKDKDMVHNGAQLLSSYQLQAAASLESSTKQIVCVFGVDENGYRITDVSEAAVTTTASGLPSDMTIDINVNMNAGVAEIEFEPSKMEAYFYDLLAYSEYEKYETDEAFFAEVMYKYSSMMQYKMTMGKAKMTTESLHKGEKYIAYAFGMDGDKSTAIFKKVFTME